MEGAVLAACGVVNAWLPNFDNIQQHNNESFIKESIIDSDSCCWLLLLLRLMLRFLWLVRIFLLTTKLKVSMRCVMCHDVWMTLQLSSVRVRIVLTLLYIQAQFGSGHTDR